jgi:hypothetical protein
MALAGNDRPGRDSAFERAFLMACGCRGTCVNCLSGYRPEPPLAFAGWRLRIPGAPRGGQYHGYLGNNPSPHDFANPGTYDRGIFRSPGETPPKQNPNGNSNVFMERHSRRQAGYAMVPGAYSQLGSVSTLPISNIRYPISEIYRFCPGPTNWVSQPPPPPQPAPAPTVTDTSTPANMYRDAAGNLTSDWHNPYSLYLPLSPSPSPSVAADTNPTPGAGQTPTSPGIAGWFSQSTWGIPNWGLAAVAAWLLLGRKR